MPFTPTSFTVLQDENPLEAERLLLRLTPLPAFLPTLPPQHEHGRSDIPNLDDSITYVLTSNYLVDNQSSAFGLPIVAVVTLHLLKNQQQQQYTDLGQIPTKRPSGSNRASSYMSLAHWFLAQDQQLRHVRNAEKHSPTGDAQRSGDQRQLRPTGAFCSGRTDRK